MLGECVSVAAPVGRDQAVARELKGCRLVGGLVEGGAAVSTRHDLAIRIADRARNAVGLSLDPEGYADFLAAILAELPEGAHAAPMMLAALTDALSGWRYIRSTHGDLYGVGWERVEASANAAIAAAQEDRP